MLLSYHPCYVGDENRLCAGRDLDESDRKAINAADGVVLPQGCRKALFEMAAAHCANVFPDYHARFTYPGKTGQSRLFKKIGVNPPRSVSSAFLFLPFTVRSMNSAGRGVRHGLSLVPKLPLKVSENDYDQTSSISASNSCGSSSTTGIDQPGSILL